MMYINVSALEIEMEEFHSQSSDFTKAFGLVIATRASRRGRSTCHLPPYGGKDSERLFSL